MEYVRLVVVIVLFAMEEVICSVCNVLQVCICLELFAVKNVALHTLIKVVIIILVFGIALNRIIYKFKYKELLIAQLLPAHPPMSNIGKLVSPPNLKVLIRAVHKLLDIFNIMIVMHLVLSVKIVLHIVLDVMLAFFY